MEMTLGEKAILTISGYVHPRGLTQTTAQSLDASIAIADQKPVIQ